ncbi:myotubularin-related protein 9-like isoform X1 [Bombina bombina]|uniref:myotubularin-related protein 9-like isoform X1 n=1 Tax=Bombina bombina TaxID=8345 RepID=UPI00235A918B|nr:myotubularin-related protein 9-like isoform X1 [Bombina bombina]XP_053560795.1 myotubularin-related protein 9-like isoform X1 [Bombina bombina]
MSLSPMTLPLTGPQMELSDHIQTSQVENVRVTCPLMPPITGTLCVSSHHLLLSALPEGDEDHDGERLELWLLHRAVDSVEKSVQNIVRFRSKEIVEGSEGKTGSGSITLKCKDLRVIQLEIPSMEATLNIARSVQALSSLDSISLAYPFFFRPQRHRLGEGWPRDTTENFFLKIKAETDSWRISHINLDFKVCPSYPPTVIVPRSCTDDTLLMSASFRRGGRFPILSYYHKSNGTALLHCSKSQAGSARHRCEKDEALLDAALLGQLPGFIIHTGPSNNAKQVTSEEEGAERQAGYWRVLHRPLERGRALQDSLVRLVSACYEPALEINRWLSKLQASRWMSHVKEALGAAGLTAECMERKGGCVLVQGKEGTDTTLLVTSLTQLILSPDCRTFDGFQDLIERDWLQAGHPFQLRCAHSGWSQSRAQHEAPLFLLFLDCCWQVARQFPFALEFSEKLLCILAEHAYSSEYGTFLCNNEKERCLYEVQDRTHSLWVFLNDNKKQLKLLNPMYEQNPLVIWPSVEPQSLQLWAGFFLQYLLPHEHTILARKRMVEIIKTSQEPLDNSQISQS